jgi:glycosyltransferase involved in cell wall biosynthesis
MDRPSTQNIIDQTHARIHRFRDDIIWHLFTHQPSPAELAQLSAWIDPAVEEDDFDGLTAEALVTGLPVVASRTPINVQRCEQGRTGFLIPPRDPNELVHAILAALFKPEVANPKISAARQTASKFRIRQRLRVLQQIYENVTT